MPEPRTTPAQMKCLCKSLKQAIHIGSGGGDTEAKAEEGWFGRLTVHKLIHIGYMQPTQAFNTYAPTATGMERAKNYMKRKRK